ncbi:MAG: hypothetical protein AB7O59_10950 [Pirellulales bacterium]
MLVAARTVAFGVALCGLIGCKVVDEQPRGRSPLVPAVAAPDQVTLEIFSAPVPLDDPQLNNLWTKVDEQPLPPEVRARLAENGLRAGVISAQMPDELASLLSITDKPIAAEARTLVPIGTEPGVSMRLLQPRAGKRHELAVSAAQNEISLMCCEGGTVRGKTYRQAEGRLAMLAFPETSGRVRLELTPELHHGEPKTQTTGSEGMFIRTTEREKRVFADLKMAATLSAGEMLLITCLDDRPNTIGHHFFVDRKGDKPTRRLWALRVAQAAPDRAFADWSQEKPTEAVVADEAP